MGILDAPSVKKDPSLAGLYLTPDDTSKRLVSVDSTTLGLPSSVQAVLNGITDAKVAAATPNIDTITGTGATGVALAKAASPATAQTAIGATSAGTAILVAADAAAQRLALSAARATSLNVMDYGATLITGTTTTASANSTSAIQSCINAVAALGGGEVVFPTGTFRCDGVTLPLGVWIRLRGHGTGASGNVFGTRLIRVVDGSPVISAVGTGMIASVRVYPELQDMQITGNNFTSDVVLISRASHLKINNVRISNNNGGTGFHGTELWDCSINTLIVETCGSGTSKPAVLLDSVVGAGAAGDCATVRFTDLVLQANYGTDIRLTGSVADVSPCNDIYFSGTKMEGTGTGVIGAPDTYPYIDLDYAQVVQFVNTRISMPTGRGCANIIQQIGTSSGARANQFSNLIIDTSGGNTAGTFINHTVGALHISNWSAPSTPPTGQYVNIGSTVSAGRFKWKNVYFDGNPVTGVPFITDGRAVDEYLDRVCIGNVALTPGANASTLIENDIVKTVLPQGVTSYVHGRVEIPRDIHPLAGLYYKVLWTTTASTGTISMGIRAAGLVVGEQTTKAQNNQVVFGTVPSAGTIQRSETGRGAGNTNTITPGQSHVFTLRRDGGIDAIAQDVKIISISVYIHRQI